MHQVDPSKTDQTTRISLQVPIMSNNTQRQKHKRRTQTLGATPSHSSPEIHPETPQGPSRFPNNVPAAGEALSRENQKYTQERK
jgi:hypothetical protein